MQLYYQMVYLNNVGWKRVVLKTYLCWSICVDTAAFTGLLWYIFK